MSTPVVVESSADDIRVEPQDALRMLVESEGFRIFHAYMRTQWGNAAVIRRIREDLESHPANEHSLLTQSNLQIADEIMKLFAWPEEEYERLRMRAKEPKPPGDRFEQHRRTS